MGGPSRSRLSFAAVLCVGLFVANVHIVGSAASNGTNAYSSRERRVLGESLDIKDVNKRFSQHWGLNIGAFLLTLLVGSAASSAGVGGGAFFVPLFNVMVGFSIKGATSLSQATITGGSLAAIALSLPKTHPTDASKSLLDYDLGLMLLPTLLFGVSLGVLANKLFPNWLVTFQLVLLLVYLTYLTIRKAVRVHRAEAEAQKRQAEAECLPGSEEGHDCQIGAEQGERDTAVPPPGDQPVAESTTESPVEPWSASRGRALPDWHPLHIINGPSAETVRDRFEDDSSGSNRPPRHPGPCSSGRRAPLAQMAEMLALWAAFLAMQLLKSRWQWCSVRFVVTYVVQGGFCLGASALFLWQAHKAQVRDTADRDSRPILEDIYSSTAWSLPSLVRASVITLVAGTVAGLLGIGGGMIVGPLLLELGVHPLVAAATSSLMVLFSASTAMLSVAFQGDLNVQFALIFGLGCLGASFIGVLGVSYLVKRSGKASIVVMLLAGITGAGALLTAIVGGSAAVSDLQTGHNIAFSSFCASS